MNIIVRGSSDYVFQFNGAFETVSGTQYGRVYVCSYDGATFGTPVMLPGQTGNAANYTATRGVVDSNGITHFVLINPTGGSPYVQHVAMAAGAVGTFGSASTVSAMLAPLGDPGFISEPSIDMVSGTETISVLIHTFVSSMISLSFFKATAVLNPTFTSDPGTIITQDSTLLDTVGANPYFDLTIAIAYAGGKYLAILMVNGGSYFQGAVYMSQSSDGGATWSTPAKLFSAPNTNSGMPNFLIDQLVAYPYSSSVGMIAMYNDSDDNPPDTNSEIAQFYST